MRRWIVMASRHFVRSALPVLVSCAGLLSSPAFAQSTTPMPDPEWRQSVERVIESYIRSHPEVIEQAFQALEAKRQEEEKAHIIQALVAHQSELLQIPRRR